MIKHSHANKFTEIIKKSPVRTRKTFLRNLSTDVLMDGINLAKSEGEHQIDYLGQAALAKLFLEEVRNQYKNIVDHFEQRIRAINYQTNMTITKNLKPEKNWPLK